VIPDQELISRVIACDDHAAFGELVRRHQSAVRGFLRHLARGDHALSDDLAQEAFVRAYRDLARFRGTSTFLTWILGIAHNQWRNARRRVQFTAFAAASDEPFVPDLTSASDLRADLAAALRTLSPDEQLALHVCYQQGLTHEEAAVLLDWPLGTVKTHVARAKEKLRQPLAAWNPQK
jgi:RNA polymerase sigma-70 factor (ECF subfamily)